MTYLHSTDTDIYENFTILHPNGERMCYCDKKKINWYLKKNLAKQIDEKTIQLLFEPKGIGDLHLSKAYENNKQNLCVVCGCEDNLTKHHIVPYQYRKHFPEAFKSHNHFDVLPVCITHHEEYEREADLFNEKLAREAGIITKSNQKLPEVVKAEKLNAIIMTLESKWDEIPPLRRDVLLREISDHFGVVDIDRSSIASFKQELVKDTPSISPASVIVSKQTDIPQFIVRWRKHFIDNMKPQFLPKGWLDDHTRFFTGE
jgi:exonuclease 3'-5' domain-containing protein 2